MEIKAEHDNTIKRLNETNIGRQRERDRERKMEKKKEKKS